MPGTTTTPTDTTPETARAQAERAADGDARALTWLYERYHDPLFRRLYVMARNRADAEDLDSQLWLTIARRISTYDSERGTFIQWASTIAARTAASHYRPLSSTETPAGLMIVGPDTACSDPGPAELTEQRAHREELAEAVAALRHKYAEVLRLRFFEGLSVADTAAVLGITEGNVKARQHRAVRALRANLPWVRNLDCPDGVSTSRTITLDARTDRADADGLQER